ncbi:zwei Ig domain protein zig-8-like [Penaeus monodon]|uniref:zwei Ig domain protein zig-8-like n=1 Tax=Penaeus monodon TaxID=6687 RepID=UPI0018A6EF6A|nr:zwei Ig domain protein zig-8-like [Penaeus monodon]
MFILLYMMCVLAVCGGQGPEEEEDFTTLPPANETDLPLVTPTRFTAAKDTQAAPLLEEEPYFDASMTATYTGYLGKTATLTCIVHAAKNDKSVSWIRGRDLRILTVGGYTYTTDLRFEAFHQPHSTEWTLRIKSVQLRDQGGYECQIATKPIRTYHVFLKVVEPTVEVVGAPDIYVNTASMINLTCVVHHAPYPPEDITWYHGNQTISYTSPRGGVSVVEERGETTTSILLLQNARASDSGTFTCQPEGMEPSQVTLHVLDGERQRQLVIQTNSSCVATSRLSALFVAAVMVTIVVL